jgi:SAM-dependent methyltransferase
VSAGWDRPYDTLRRQWHVVPVEATSRLSSKDLLQLSDAELLAVWDRAFHGTSTGSSYGIRGWYHDLYRDKLAGLEVLDLGCGLAVSSLHFAEHGASLTFSDIVEDNLRVVERLCALKGVRGRFLHIDDASSFADLADDFAVVMAIGSLINAPRDLIREEVQAILPHLRPDARWLYFAYPRARWIHDGSPPFSEWGKYTDGPDTPWMEYHERETLEYFPHGHSRSSLSASGTTTTSTGSTADWGRAWPLTCGGHPPSLEAQVGLVRRSVDLVLDDPVVTEREQQRPVGCGQPGLVANNGRIVHDQ